jgi:hypothetical protein
VTSLNENTTYEVVSLIRTDIHDFLAGGTILDHLIELKTDQGPLKVRLITFKDPLTGKVFRFLSNLFDFQSHTIVLLYKNRWEIEPFFKRIKQNFKLGYFFSDSREGIKTQVWMLLIANLIFYRDPQADQRSRAVNHHGVHGQSQPHLLCLLPDHPKNQLPGSR